MILAGNRRDNAWKHVGLDADSQDVFQAPSYPPPPPIKRSIIVYVFQGSHLDDASFPEDVHVTVGRNGVCQVEYLDQNELRCKLPKKPVAADGPGNPAIKVETMFRRLDHWYKKLLTSVLTLQPVCQSWSV